MIEECFSKDFITIQLHATAELMSLFFSKDIKLEDIYPIIKEGFRNKEDKEQYEKAMALSRKMAKMSAW